MNDKNVKKMIKLLKRIKKEYEKQLHKLCFYKFKNYCDLNNYELNYKNYKIWYVNKNQDLLASYTYYIYKCVNKYKKKINNNNIIDYYLKKFIWYK